MASRDLFRSAAPLVLLAGLFAGAPLPAADLSIGHFEITQGLQSAANDIPLIRHKPTVVRVFPVARGFTEPPQVSALLHARRRGAELAGSPLRQSRGTVTAAAAVDRGSDEAALIFEDLPADWISQDTEFWVELEPDLDDDKPANNRYPHGQGTFKARFQESGRLDIRFVKIRFRNGGPKDGLPEADVTRRGAVSWLQSVFPIAPENVRYAPWNPTEIVFQNPGRPDPTKDLNGSALITDLDSFWGKGKPPDLLFAWTPTGSFSSNGKSDPPFRLVPFPPGRGRVAFGNSNKDRYRRTLAHEMAHNLGIKCHHNEIIPSDLIGYDVTSVDPNQGSIRLAQAGRGPVFDLMKPGEVEANAWIVPWTYRSLLAALKPGTAHPGIFECTSLASAGAGDIDGPSVPVVIPAGTTHLLAVRGEVRENGGAFFPFYQVPAEGAFLAAAQTVPTGGQGRNEVRFLSRTGAILQRIRWTPGIDLDDSQKPTTSAPFTWFVPVRDDVGAVLLLRGETRLATLVVPKKAPQIEQPRVGGVRTETSFDGSPQELRTVRWQEVRTGEPGPLFDEQDLRHRLSFSNDDGKTWVLVATNLAASSVAGQVDVEIDQSLLPGGPRCRFKVTTSDGYNVTEQESDPFELPDRAPQAQILSLDPNKPRLALPQGAGLRLVGEAFDPEEGALPGDKLKWWSSRQGDLGRGDVLERSDLLPGKHEIRLTATDKAGNLSAPAIVTVDVIATDEP